MLSIHVCYSPRTTVAAFRDAWHPGPTYPDDVMTVLFPACATMVSLPRRIQQQLFESIYVELVPDDTVRGDNVMPPTRVMSWLRPLVKRG